MPTLAPTPFIGDRASGRIGEDTSFITIPDQFVQYTYKGIAYAYHRYRNVQTQTFRPPTPHSPDPLAPNRSLVTERAANWKTLTQPQQSTWLPLARKNRLPAYTVYMSENLRRHRDGLSLINTADQINDP